MAEPHSDALLDLDTLAKRDVINIDGVPYEVYSPHELSVITSHRFGRWGDRMKELDTQDGKKAEEELTKIIDAAARQVFVDLPDEVFAKLSGQAKRAVVEVFSSLLWRRALGVAGAMHQAAGTTNPLDTSLSIGDSSSPGSFGSTAARLARGFMKRLFPWSGPA